VANHKGGVVFVEGVHYAIDKDGNANKDKPLRWEGGDFRDAEPDEQLHNDAYGGTDTTLEPGSE
jgi:hypothetical protein